MTNIEPTPLSQDNLLLGKNLLAKLRKRELTMEEFEKETAYFALECGFDELHFMDFPEKPAELRAFSALGEKQKKEVNEDFWRQEIVIYYFKKWHETLAWNRGTRSWINELLRRFKKYEDHINVNRVEERLQEWAGQSLEPSRT